MIDTELLEILVCPETRQSLRPAEPALLARVNRAVERRALYTRGGDRVESPLDDALVRADGEVLYPVRDEIPIMLLDEAIVLGEIADDEQDHPPTS